MPTTVVLPVLALLWGAVLIPVVVRRVREYRAVERIDSFHDSLHLLDRSSDAAPLRRPGLVLLQPVTDADDALDPYVDEFSGDCFDRVPVRAEDRHRTPCSNRRRKAALRRRTVLVTLLAVLAVDVVAAIVTGTLVAVGAVVVTFAVLAAYVAAMVVLFARQPDPRVRRPTAIEDAADWRTTADGF